MTRDELLHWYERELTFIRKMAMGFAEKYPEVAGRLLLEPTKCEDPHVERLIEAFAMMAARIQMRLNDDFSEVSDSLLSILYPHYLCPIPSMTIVQLKADPEAAASEGLTVPRHALLHSKPVGGVRCRFRTAYPVELWPVEVESVEHLTATALGVAPPPDVRSALRIRLRTEGGVPFSELALGRLRFFLDADSGVVDRLYQAFLRDPRGLFVQSEPAAPAYALGGDAVAPVGFAPEEGLLEYPPESFVGYRLLQEYFAFSDKFLFVDLCGLRPALEKVEGDRADVSVLLSESVGELDLRVGPENLRLGCTPAVNLFPHTADPIRVTHASVEYPVVPDARSPAAYEVYTVRGVASTTPGSAESREFQPFYALRHGSGDSGEGAFWHAARRSSLRRDDAGTEVYLTLVDEKFHPLVPPADVLNVETLCTNRDLPARLPFGDPGGDFMLEQQTGISRITCLRSPTVPLRAPGGEGSRWRLVSHLALNYLSLSDDAEFPAGDVETRALGCLREILKLYDFVDSPVTRQRIAGLIALRSRKVVRRIGHGDLSGFARGVEVALEFDPAQYTGTGVFVFASVLEAFLGLYTSVNSFTQTLARIRGREGELKRWPPRAGEARLL